MDEASDILQIKCISCISR